MDESLLIDGPVVFFTGAGVSVGSGLPTYRGNGGIYTNSDSQPPNVDDLQPDRLPLLWKKFGPRLDGVERIRPAIAHQAMAAFEAASERSVTVITQNVDGLDAASGNTAVLELHGNLRALRCVKHQHRHHLDEMSWDGTGVPVCPTCGADCRPDVVLFGESLNSTTWEQAEAAIERAATIVAAGTSGVVTPAAYLLDPQLSPHANCIWVNPEDAPPPARRWTWLRGTADEHLPRLTPRQVLP